MKKHMTLAIFAAMAISGCAITPKDDSSIGQKSNGQTPAETLNVRWTTVDGRLLGAKTMMMSEGRVQSGLQSPKIERKNQVGSPLCVEFDLFVDFDPMARGDETSLFWRQTGHECNSHAGEEHVSGSFKSGWQESGKWGSSTGFSNGIATRIDVEWR